MPRPHSPGRLERWLEAAPAWTLVLYATFASFSTYFCMYAFRKPFTAAQYAGETLLGTQLIGLGIARAHYDKGLRGKSLESAVFSAVLRARPSKLDYKAMAARWSNVADAWPMPRVNAAILAARRADFRLKDTTLADERAVLIDLVMGLAYRDREAA